MAMAGGKVTRGFGLIGVGLALVLIAAGGRKRRRPAPDTPVRYTDAVEQHAPDEADTVAAILRSLHRLHERDLAKFGRPVRVSHAKAHGVAIGELVVPPDLPRELAQGLFAQAGRYPAIVRLANVPGEIDSDIVGTQRGLALKLLGVGGEMLPGHQGEQTQDWVLDTGNRFAAGTAKQFLHNHLLLEHAPQLPDAVKGAVSAASRGANRALNAVGADSAILDFFGHPRLHPLAETYFSQAPIRFGDHIAKLAIVPVAPAQRALADSAIDPAADPDALRTATIDYFAGEDAEFDLRVQLCTDLKDMPVEDASVEWPESRSPYRTVARLRLPRQDAFSPARRAWVDEALSFSPAHSLAAHRPLGSVMRARLAAYPHMARVRREATGRPPVEPRSLADVPA